MLRLRLRSALLLVSLGLFAPAPSGQTAFEEGANGRDARGRDARGRDARGRDASGRGANGRAASGGGATVSSGTVASRGRGGWLTFAHAQERRASSSEVAREAIAAFDGKDTAELERLARLGRPGIWPVADALLVLGRADVAIAAAKVSDDEAAEALLALLEKEKDLPPDTKAREAVEAANAAFGRRDLDGVLAALDGVEGRGLAGLWVVNGRSMALRFLERHTEASASFVEAADLAGKIGYLKFEAHVLLRASQEAQAAGDTKGRCAALRRMLAVHEKRGDDNGAAAAAIDLGIALTPIGEEREVMRLYRQGIELARKAGNDAFLANGLTNLAAHLVPRGELDEAEALLTEARKLHTKVGNRTYAARATGWLADVHLKRGRTEEAIRLLREALAIHQEEGDRSSESATQFLLAHALGARGAFAEALEAAEAGLEIAREGEDPRAIVAAEIAVARTLNVGGRRQEAHERVLTTLASLDEYGTEGVFGVLRARALVELGGVEMHMGQFAASMAHGREALDLLREAGEPDLTVRARTLYGNALVRLGEAEAGLTQLSQALAHLSARPPTADLAQAHANVGFAYLVKGEFAPAIERTLAARALYENLGDARMAAQTLINVGAVYGNLGDLVRAIEVLEEAVVEIAKSSGKSERAAAVINLGAMLMRAERPDEARQRYDEGLRLARESGARLWELTATVNLANLAAREKDATRADALFTSALALARELGALREIALIQSDWAAACAERGDHEAGLAHAAAALAAAEECADDGVTAAVAFAQADALIAAGRAAEGVPFARRAAEFAARMSQGVPATNGGYTGLFFNDLLWMSMRMAAGGAELADVFDLTERARAGQLLEGLGGRQALRESTVPAALAEEEQRRRLDVVTRRGEFERARDAGELKPLRAARARLIAAEDAYGETVVRIQLATRAGAAVFPQPVALADVQKALSPGETLVSFTVTSPKSFAIVVERERARLVDLGDPQAIDDAVQALRGADGPGPSQLEALRKVLVAPLGLTEACKRLIVAPQGATGMVPFAALVGDRTVAMVPSATAHGLLLRSPSKAGEGVLALGDPVYDGTSPGPVALRGGALSPLPGTRDEVRAIGDVVLLGAKATEPGLTEALRTKPRWRAVHLACHGLVDEEKPLRSALAVTPGGGEDGYLSVLDVHRLRVPADLVVLSACESGRGRVSQSQGVIGFTGAFLLSGADRVVASLWKVDDQATAALMKHFYALWKGGATAADALRGAQEHVRSQEAWSHPRYWAAWQLWGRTD